MNAERWARLQALFERIVDTPIPDREAALLEACPDDAELRAEVRSMVAALPAFDEVFQRPGLRASPQEPTALEGLRVGPYRLLREIGRGGMGTVVLAERADGEYEQRVAIKFVSTGSIGRELGERLRTERQILARLAHPNIARLLDGGTTEDGAPYVVMEYVDGVTLSTHAAERGLDVRARVELFIPICEAVEHAHRAGVIHRDLKPGNVLVTAEGVPKLLDFGIAKVVETVEGDDRTRTVARRLTPQYASPEQIRGDEVGPVTDVYGLGAVLYRLLTGHPPHAVEGTSLLDLERVICHTTPTLPSVRAQANDPEGPSPSAPTPRDLKGDLDTIVLKALQVDPARRYGTAAALAADLRRWLERRPVLARPDTAVYRLTRFAQRHRSQVGFAGVAALALVYALLPRGPAPATLTVDPDRVAVAVFDNQSSDPELDALGVMAMDWIVDGLARTGTVDVVPGVVSVAVHQQASLLPGGAGSPAAPPIAAETGAGVAVTGSLYLVGDSIEIRTRIIDAVEGTLLQNIDPVRAPLVDRLAALPPLRSLVTAGLSTVLNPRLSDDARVMAIPPSLEAYQAFVEGAEAYVRLDDERALEGFRRAARLDHTYGSAHLASCLPLGNLGRIEEADSVARWLDGSGIDLAPFERASLDFLLAYFRGDREEAFRHVVRGAEVAPTSILGYQAAREALETRRPRQAIERLLGIDPTRGTMNGWVSYWTILTRAYHALDEHRTELRLARQGRKQYPESMAVLAAEAQALAARGRLWQLGSLLEEATGLEPQLGWTVERIGLSALREFRAHGHGLDLRIATGRVREALAEAGPPESAADAIGLASAHYEIHAWTSALEVLSALPDSATDIEALRIDALRTLARVRLGAEDGTETARRLEADTAPYRFGEPLFWASRIHAVAGRESAAIQALARAYQAGFPANIETHREQDFEGLRSRPAFQALHAPIG